MSRSEAKRKLGDNVGADRDYWAAIKMEEQAKNGQLPKTSSSGSNTAVNGDAKTDDSEENTREQSDKNINKFNRLVVYDKEQERKSKYQSEVRGRVQDRNVHVDLEPVCLDLLREGGSRKETCLLRQDGGGLQWPDGLEAPVGGAVHTGGGEGGEAQLVLAGGDVLGHGLQIVKGLDVPPRCSRPAAAGSRLTMMP